MPTPILSDEFFIWTDQKAKEANHASSYYRINVPLGYLTKSGLANVYQHSKDNQQESVMALMYSDIAQMYAMAGIGTLHRVESMRAKRPGKHGDTVIYPPALIYDHDDNVDFVHPFNSTYVSLGTRDYPAGKMLEAGDVIQYFDHEDRPVDLWVDQETMYNGQQFDIQRNLHDMKVRYEILQKCDGATATTPALASYFKEVMGQPNVYVFPNTIDMSDYEFFDTARADQKVRILWQGSNSHYIDWYPLREPLKRIVEKYRDKVTFVIFGEYFRWIHDVIPADMIEHHPWKPYEAYKLKRGLLNCDINLCPLVDNMFNRCKSAIKWYEASVWNKPEATLAAKVEPYHEIEDNVTGLLYTTGDEFVEKLSLLIEDADLRTRLGAAAKEWVLANRTPERTVPGLLEFYQDVRARQKRRLADNIVKPATLEDLKRMTAKR